MIGQTVSHYTILEKLGEGGMGEVYLAEDTRLHRRVALKFLPAALQKDPDARERLLREARAASKLHHPNIVTIHAIEEQDGRDFIVMEYVEGMPITQYVQRHEAADAKLHNVLRQLCEGLHHAHAAGIVHRDLKPDNILVEAEGRVRIMDFGVAILRGTERLTQTGSMVGTTAYLSPEQIRGQDADFRSDLFSLGVLMYELVADTHPFAGTHEAATLYAIAHEPPPALATRSPGASESLIRVIETCMAKNPGDRFHSAREAGRLITQDTVAEMEAPETRYTKSGTTNIAYQVFGEGEHDLVLVSGWVSHVELIWKDPHQRRMLERLGRSCRVILFDKRGTGLSDRVAELPTLEQRMDDVRAVMDAVGSKRAILFGVSEGGPMCLLFAATYPERTVATIVFGSYALRIRDKEYPWGPSWEEREKTIADAEENWGGLMDIADLAPSLADDSAYRKMLVTYFRQSASPGAAAALLRMNSHVDIRSLLPEIRVPTMILHRRGDREVVFGGAEYMARRIPQAQFVPLEGEDHLPWIGDTESIMTAVEEFTASLKPTDSYETALMTALHLQTDEISTGPGRNILDGIFDEIKPRIVHWEDRGVTALFDGAIRSLRAAEQIAEQLSAAGCSWSIGVHAGECALSSTDSPGLPVEVARKLATSGEGGRISVTTTVAELSAEVNFPFEECDRVSVDGVERVWQVLELRREVPVAVNEHAASVAVLPFANMSNDPENEYFSDGLTEELINVLARNPELKVTGRTSSFAFKGKQEDLRVIGQKLAVGTLLEGSVRKSGHRVRITAQLVKASDGFHLWSETYDRILDDIFAVQDDIAASVSAALNVTLLRGTSSSKHVNAEAYNLVLQANNYATRNSREALSEADKLYKKALELDPGAARAWAGLSKSYGFQAGQGFMDYEEGSSRAREAALRALALDDKEPKAYEAMGWVRFIMEINWKETRKNFERALELAPGDSGILTGLSVFELCVGNVERSRDLALKAVELDPLSAFAHRELARPYVASGDWENAAICYRKALDLSPDIVVAHSLLGLTYMYQGQVDKGIAEAKKEKSTGYRLYALASLYHVAGRTEESDEALRELVEGAEGGVSWAFQVAFVHAIRNELDDAFHWLDLALQHRDTGTVLIKTHPGLKSLHSDPRYPKFLKKIGLTP